MKLNKRIIGAISGVLLGIAIVGSTMAFAASPCNHSYGLHTSSVCYHSATVGSHVLSDGRTCNIIEYLYHNYGDCNRCGAHITVYGDTVETRHSISH